MSKQITEHGRIWWDRIGYVRIGAGQGRGRVVVGRGKGLAEEVHATIQLSAAQ